VHGIVEDDPQNPKQAESEAERKSANDFHDGTLSTRFSDRNAFWHLIVDATPPRRRSFRARARENARRLDRDIAAYG
jgi:hypothetical protein